MDRKYILNVEGVEVANKYGDTYVEGQSLTKDEAIELAGYYFDIGYCDVTIEDYVTNAVIKHKFNRLKGVKI